MSGPKAIPTFVGVDEYRDTITLHYLTPGGEPGSFTFGVDNEVCEYELASFAHCGRGSEPDHEVQIFVRRRGDKRTKATDEVEATHHFRVALSNEDGYSLAWLLSNFMRAADDLVKTLTTWTPKLEGVSYSDDYITLQLDGRRTLKLGLVSGRYRFTLMWHGWDFPDGIVELKRKAFGFLDDNGKSHRVVFSAPLDESERLDAVLSAYLEALKENRPKAEIAIG